jgi:hypothetical protein
MRNGQNKQRMRNRNNNNNNNNRRGQNPMTRVYESNGPDIKIRGTASHVAEKYLQLARDARSSGDPVAAENYYQHAEHYFRLIAAAQEQFRQNQQQPRGEEVATGDDSEDDGENFSNFGQEPGFAPQPQQQQPFMRDGQREHQRDHQRGDSQLYQRDQQQPREHRERDHRPQPQYQPQPQPQPVIGDSGRMAARDPTARPRRPPPTTISRRANRPPGPFHISDCIVPASPGRFAFSSASPWSRTAPAPASATGSAVRARA